MNTGINNKTQMVMKRSVRFLCAIFIIGIFSHGVKAQNVVEIGTATTTSYQGPLNELYNYSWTRMLYYGSEIGTSTSGGKITKIAYYFDRNATVTLSNQKVFMRAVPSTTVALTTGYVNPSTSGIVEVYSGNFVQTPLGWSEITLTTPFVLPPGHNLEILWEDRRGTYTSSNIWRRSTTIENTVVRAQSDASFPTTAGSADKNRSNLRITWELLARTAAVSEVLSPEVRFQWDGASKIPVDVKIANDGTDTITSCDVNWSVNGSSVVTHSNSTLLIQGAAPLAMNLDSMVSSQITANKRNLLTVYVDNALPFDNNQGDDTVKVDFFPCTYFLNGTYTIGGTTPDFATIGDAIDHLMNCGVEGPVTFNIRTGTYTGDSIFLLGEIPGASAYNTVTFTSESGDADDVTITNTGTTVKLAEVSYVRFQNLTLGGTTSAATRTVVFEESCEDILFHHCKINTYSSGTNNTYCGVYYYPSNGHSYKLTDIRFIGNEITGGYASFYFNYMSGAAASERGTVTIDSNIMTNFYYGGVYSDNNGYFTSISYNNMVARTVSATQYLIRMNANNTVEKMVNNSIRSAGTSTTYGLYFNSNFNYYSKTGLAGSQAPCEMYNNEIILLGSGTKHGVYLNSAKVNMYHNSVYLGGSGINYGLNIASVSTAYPINAKNNIFVTTTSSASSYPLYAANATHVTTALGTTLDYNNYYSTKGLLGTIGGTTATYHVSSLAMLQNVTGQDRNSISIAPHFRDINTSLYLHSIALQAPELSAVFEDHDGNTRNSMTSMGAFEFVPEQIDLEVVSMVTPTDVVVIGASTPVTARIYNVGLTPVSGFTVALHFNNVLQGSAVSYAGTLNPTEYADVILPNVIPVAGNNTFKIISYLATDTVRVNDTLQVTLPACDSLMHGRYTIGTGGDFATIAAALAELNRCGIDGPVELAYLKNTSAGALTVTGMIVGANQQNTVTITSNDDDADSVIFTTVTFNEASYWKLKYVTVGSSTATGHKITFTNNNKSIEVSECKILSDPTTATASYGINRSGANSTAIRDIVIKNNLIDGGTYNIYISQLGASGNLGDITIDDNILTNAATCGVFMSSIYGDVKSISNNTIQSRTASGTYTGIWGGSNYLYGGIEIMNANKIRVTGTGTLRGIYFMYNVNYSTSYTTLTTPMLVINNEVIVEGTTTESYGMYFNSNNNTTASYSIRARVYHNSVYVKTTTEVANGIFRNGGSTTAANRTFFKYNNIYVETTTGNAYPFRIGTATHAGPTYMELDSNNYVHVRTGASGNTYYGTTATTTLAAWRTACTQEAATREISQGYIAGTLPTDLYTSVAGLSVPTNSVEKDIRGLVRVPSNNLIGAYAYLFDEDASLEAFIAPESSVIAGQATDIDVKLINFGNNTLTSVDIGYTIFDGTTTTPGSFQLQGISLASLKDTVIRLNQQLTALPNRFYTITAWVANPNNTVDQNVHNDTISMSTYACDSALKGDYTVGGSGSPDFATLDEAIEILENCGVSGPVRFLLANGNYAKLSLNGISNGRNETNTVTFTSLSGNANDVTFIATDTALVLQNTGHLRFENITIGTNSTVVGVCFIENGENIEFYGCNINALPSATTTYNCVRYYYSATHGFRLDDVRFIKNNITGGSYAFYFNWTAATSAPKSVFTIDSNEITGFHLSAIYTYYNSYFKSISNNIITSASVSSTQNGIYLSYYTSVEEMKSNKIRLNGTSTCYGFNFQPYTNEQTMTGGSGMMPCEMYNNEVIISSGSGTKYGIYDYYTVVNAYNNSIYLGGTGTTNYGLYCANKSVSYPAVYKNNVFITASGSSSSNYPLYFGNNVTYPTQALGTTLDYNNYYSTGPNIGYAAGAYTSLSAWQTVSGQDANSMSAMPNFNNTAIDLSTDGMAMLVPRISSVRKDIRNTARTALTNAGAYHDFEPQDNDVRALSLAFSTGDLQDGVPTIILMDIQNIGNNTIDSVMLYWNVNGTINDSLKWIGTLEPGAYANNINIGSFVPQMGKCDIIAYTSSPNAMPDDYPANDTITYSTYVCSGIFAGVYTVGDASADFLTYNDAIDAINVCGINGRVELQFMPGTYGALDINATTIPGFSTSDTIVITSYTGNASDVKFMASATPALSLNVIRNWEFRNVTFDATSGTHGVYMVGACSNVVVTYCNILLDPSSTSSYYGFYTTTSSVKMDIVVSNNFINGGCHSIYLQNMGSGTGVNMGTIRIDSNIMSNAYNSGIWFPSSSYAIVKSLSYNTISKRPTSTTAFYGIYTNNTNATASAVTFDTIQGNKFHLINNDAISGTLYGMYLYAYINYYNKAGGTQTAVSPVHIVNNEIILKSTSACYGIYSYANNQINFLHNSLYLTGASSTSYMMYRYQPTTVLKVSFMYNSVYVANTTTSVYMIYPGSSTTYYPSTYGLVDSNNYYRSSTGTTYYSASYTALANWQASTYNQDKASTANMPRLAATDPIAEATLALTDTVGLSVATASYMTTDIIGKTRGTTTAKGAYDGPFPWDVTPVAITKPVDGIAMMMGNTYDLEVKIKNVGSSTVTAMEIHYEVNGSSGVNNWNGTLPQGAETTVMLINNTFTPISGANTVKVFTVIPDAIVGNKDEYQKNDTIYKTYFACDSLMNGRYTVGDASADFLTLDDALTELSRCGINGSVELALASGSYGALAISGVVNGTSANTTITITSQSGDPDDVDFTTATFTVASYWKLNNVTVGASSYTSGNRVTITGACHYIDITNCKILLSPTATSGYGIARPVAGGTCSNINICDNILIGGQYNMYFIGLGTSLDRAWNIVIDRNVCSSSYTAGIYLGDLYADVRSLSYNTITMQTSNTADCFGIRFQNHGTYDTIQGNKIHVEKTSTGKLHGMYSYYYFNYASRSGSIPFAYIANNEIIVKATSGETYGFFFEDEARADILHNSVYVVTTTGTSYGIWRDEYPSYVINFMYNNVYLESSGNAIKYPYSTNNQTPINGTKDYNNYYTSGAGTVYFGTTAYQTLAAWTNVGGAREANSTQINPGYTVGTVPADLYASNLDLSINTLEKDIRGLTRTLQNNMVGAYVKLQNTDIGVEAILSPEAMSDAGISTPITVTLKNYGLSTITSVTVYYQIDGGTATSALLSPMSLASLKDTTITLTSFMPVVGNYYTIKVWTSQPNSTTDQEPINDTLSFTTYACVGALAGTYDIGGGNNDFVTLDKAIEVLENCGVEGPVVFRLADNNYSKFRIEKIYKGTSAINTITFTSLSGNASNVVLNATDTALVLQNAGHLRFENITIGTNNTEKGVCFIENGENIEFYGCNINVDAIQIGNTYAPVYYSNSSGHGYNLKDIRFIKNTLTGGYASFYFNYPSGSQTGLRSTFTIDSNEMKDFYYYGIYSYYNGYYHSISNNIITSRDVASEQRALYLYYYNTAEKIINNKIKLNTSSGITHGMYLYEQFNHYTTTGATGMSPSEIYNNEIISVNSSNSSYGIYLYRSKVNIYHNSIYLGGSGAHYGLYFSTMNTTYPAVIKNNTFVTTTSNATNYPIYAGTAANATQTNGVALDYNNYYSTGSNVGYVGGAQQSLAALQIATGQDANSMSVMPNFNDVTIDLSTDGMEMLVPRISSVSKDIRDNSRIELTNAGAYHDFVPNDNDVRAVALSFSAELLNGTQTDILLDIQNIGNDTIDSVMVYWNLNGGVKSSFKWTGELEPNAFARNINIGSLTPSVGFCNIVVHTDLPNGKPDDYPANDTISHFAYVCSGAFSGVYTVGDENADFATFNDAMLAINTCGINGKVELQFVSGTYDALDITSSTITDFTTSDTMVITSITGNPEDVIFKSSGGVALTTNAIRNWEFRNVSFDATAGTHGVQLVGACTNIVITYCHILASTVAETQDYCGVFRTNGSGVLIDITISNNKIDGGYANLSLSYVGAGSSSTNTGTMRIDSNVLSNAYCSGIYFMYPSYVHVSSISYNTITKRSASTGTFYAIGNTSNSTSSDYITIDTIASNKIHLINTYTGQLYGFYFYYSYLNNSSKSGATGASVPPVHIVNNEIILKTAASTCYGTYMYYYCDFEFLHNSVYIENATTAYGLHRYINSTPYKGVFKYNNVYINSTGTVYPIYAWGSSSVNLGPTYGVIDSNNYYRTGGTTTYYNYSSLSTLAAWQNLATNGQDKASANNLPRFSAADPIAERSLALSDTVGLSVRTASYMTTDITGKTRGTTTAKGAYDGPYPWDITPIEIVVPTEDYAVMLATPYDLDVRVKNEGSSTVTLMDVSYEINGVLTGTERISVNLLPAQDTVVRLLTSGFTPTQRINTIKIYTAIPNGPNNDDMNRVNDTIVRTYVACDSILNGVYSVGGATADFASIADVLDALDCGVNGPVVFEMNSGEYYLEEIFRTGNVNGISSSNTITFTSKAGHADSVRIYGLETSVKLTDVNHFRFTHLTFGDNTSSQNTVVLNGNCTDISFYACTINAETQIPSIVSSSCAVSMAYSKLENISFIKNKLIGGTYGFYIIYAGATSNWCGPLVIDSNIIEDFYYQGIYSKNYINYESVSYNRLTSRISSNEQYGFNFSDYNSVGEMRNNSIRIATTGTAYGMYLYNNFSYYTMTGGTTFPACNAFNNEVIIENGAGMKHGVILGTARLFFYHNSIYVGGIGENRGLSILSASTGARAEIKYNNIVNASPNSLAVSLYAMNSNCLLQYYLVFSDYNNYYTVGNAYVNLGGTISARSLSELQSLTVQDNNSISVDPEFTDVTTNLKAESILLSTSLTIVTNDIENTERTNPTSLGAYHYIPDLSLDLAVVELLEPSSLIMGQMNPVSVRIYNRGAQSINNFTVRRVVNGSVVDFNYAGFLNSLDYVDVDLDSIIPIAGANTFEIISVLQGDVEPNNDTLRQTITSCDSVMNGRYTVGNASADFLTLDDALAKLNSCGINGAVELAFKTGIYPEQIILTGSVKGANDRNTVTITSQTGNPDDVMFSYAGVSQAAITVSDAAYWRFEKITIGSGSASTYRCFEFVNNNNNIEITGCKLLGNSTTSSSSSSYSVIYRIGGNSTIVRDIIIKDNIINGGYYNMYISGLGYSGNLGSIIIDGNTLTNAYYSGIYMSSVYGDVKSISNNIIQSRVTAPTTYYGIYAGLNTTHFYGSLLKMVGNKVLIKATTSTTYGISFGGYINTSSSYGSYTGTALIANNEIITDRTTGIAYGIYDYFTATSYVGRLNIRHNSIYMNATTSGTVHGYYRGTGTSSNKCYFKQNNIYINTTGTTAYPIYVYNTAAAFLVANIEIDSNNYYRAGTGTTYYATTSYGTLAAWRSAHSQDLATVQVDPSYIGSPPADLSTAAAGLLVPVNEVEKDIRGLERVANNNLIGAYVLTHSPDAGLESFIAPDEMLIVNQNANIDVKLVNYGDNILTSVDIKYSINGVLQPTVSVTGLSLASLEDTVIRLTSVYQPLSAQQNTLIAWTENPNGSADQNVYNDTIEMEVYSCDSALKGDYTVGGSGSPDFATLNDALTALENCGVAGNVVFHLADGNYPARLRLEGIYRGMDANNTVTFTALSGDVNGVVFDEIDTALVLKNTGHFRFENITIGTNSSNMGICFIENGENIEFYGCNINTKSVSGSSYSCVRYNNSTGHAYCLDDIRFIKNKITGGYQAFYFNYSSGAPNSKRSTFTIDSNEITNFYYYGVYASSNAHFKSVSNNVISSAANSSTQHGMNFSSAVTVEKIHSNKIKMNGSSGTKHGIYISSLFNLYSPSGSTRQAPCEMYNNEIIIPSSSGTKHGIYLSQAKVNCYHNSVYVGGTGTSYGLNLVTMNTDYPVVVKNNSFVTASTAAASYAIYVATAANATLTNGVSLDYNNYYSAGSNLCYIGTTLQTLYGLQTATGQDANSINVLPSFKNITTNLSTNGEEMVIIRMNQIERDIRDSARTVLTNMGAYHDIDVHENDVRAIALSFTTGNLVYQTSTDIFIDIQNRGNQILDSVLIYWTLNGVLQSPTTWRGSLNPRAFERNINIGSITPQHDIYEIVAYTTLPNGVPDAYPADDTVRYSQNVCPPSGFTGEDYVTICSSELPYRHGDSIFAVGTTTNTYIVPFTSFVGCDSIITLHLTVNPVHETPYSATICARENYVDANFNLPLPSSGVYRDTVPNQYGCDSILILTLTVNPVNETPYSATICARENYVDANFNLPLPSSGEYRDTVPNQYGCDSILILTLTVNPVHETPYAATICEREDYIDANFNLPLPGSGVYRDTVPNQYGCDSILILTLTVNPVYESLCTATICERENYIDANFNLIAPVAGEYRDTVPNQYGCDSIFILMLTVNPVNETPYSATICARENYSDANFNLSLPSSGEYRDTVPNQYGCDSILILTLTVNPVHETPYAATICEREDYIDANFNLPLPGSGVYRDTVPNQYGCDSILILTLTVNPVYESLCTATICERENYIDANFNLIAPVAGEYRDTVPNQYGCDSIFILMLTVNPVDETPYTATICEREDYVDANFNLLLPSSGEYRDTVPNQYGCDSILILTLTVNPVHETPYSATICANENYIDANFNLVAPAAGEYRDTVSNQYGCDSILILTLTVNPSYDDHVDALTICSSELPYPYGDSTFAVGTLTGVYPIMFTSIDGCDSLVTLTLTVNPSYDHIDAVTICSIELPYQYGDSIFDIGTVTGVYPIEFTTADDCDSIVTLTLTVNLSYDHTDMLSICSNELPYTYGSTVFGIGTVSGNYTVPFTTVNGCDSIIDLTLTVNPSYDHTDAVVICSSELPYRYGDRVFAVGTVSGDYTINFTSVNDCDSVITLSLTVSESVVTEEILSICDDELPYTYGDTILTKAGFYRISTKNQYGCDSTINLVLEVFSKPANPGTIEWEKTDIQDVYAYYVGPVVSATLYKWEISNPLWSIVSTVGTRIHLYIPKGSGPGTVSLVVENDCGSSSASSTKVEHGVSVVDFEEEKMVLGQNIPNPASTMARIPYTIPEDGELVFKLMSANGQILFTRKIDGFAGEQYLEIDIQRYPSGIYFYSMEYKGKTMVKKMDIQR